MGQREGFLNSRAAKICAALLLFFLILRLGIFGIFRKSITERLYDRPLPLRNFGLRRAELPASFSLPASDTGDPVIMPASEALAALPSTLDLPELSARGEAALARYRGPGKGGALLLTVVLESADKAEAAALTCAKASTAEWRVQCRAQDDRLTIGVAQEPSSPAPLLAAIEAKLKARKDWLRKVEKLKVIGNAILKMMIDLLVFGFVFVVVLFICKWVFIIRPLQES